MHECSVSACSLAWKPENTCILWAPWRFGLRRSPTHANFMQPFLEAQRSQLLERNSTFYHSAITKPVACARIMVEMGSHLTKRVPVQSHNSFLDQRSWKVIVWFHRNHFCAVWEPCHRALCERLRNKKSIRKTELPLTFEGILRLLNSFASQETPGLLWASLCMDSRRQGLCWLKNGLAPQRCFNLKSLLLQVVIAKWNITIYRDQRTYHSTYRI